MAKANADDRGLLKLSRVYSSFLSCSVHKEDKFWCHLISFKTHSKVMTGKEWGERKQVHYICQFPLLLSSSVYDLFFLIYGESCFCLLEHWHSLFLVPKNQWCLSEPSLSIGTPCMFPAPPPYSPPLYYWVCLFHLFPSAWAFLRAGVCMEDNWLADHLFFTNMLIPWEGQQTLGHLRWAA